MDDLDRLLGDFRRIARSAEAWANRIGAPNSGARLDQERDARTLGAVLALLEVASLKPTDETLERMARAHDAEDAAQRGEPSPWRSSTAPLVTTTAEDDELWRLERIAAMRAAVEALAK